jgi:hypothetical protein
MYDPKIALTEAGYEEWIYHLRAIEGHLSQVECFMDDLHVGALDIKQEDIIYQFHDLLTILRTGDGEKYED